MPDVISRAFRLMVPHGKLSACIDQLEEGLGAMRQTAYHAVLGRDFLHLTDAATEYLINFHRQAGARIHVAAMYFEMNGFTINPDLWYFDGFAYETAGDEWDLEWLAHWDADSGTDQCTLTGMELVQEAFAHFYCDESQPLSVAIASELAECLVMARFMQLIAAAHEMAKRTYKPLDGLPILATAHDCDTVHQTQ